jgi:glycosyltransferase involved in cell wall biosynthesis
MKVAVSVAGAFHAFHLADQLQRHGALDRLVTNYPPAYINRRFRLSLDPSRIRSNYLHAPYVAVERWLPDLFDKSRPFRLAHDRFASFVLDPRTDILVGWSGCSLRTIRKANRLGITSIVVRGSAHISEQMDILEAEYRLLGLPFRRDGGVVAQEIAEYAEADYVQTNSNFAAQTLVKRGVPAEKIIMVNTGVDLERFTRKPKSDCVFRVVTSGRQSVRKGTHVLLRAFAELDLPNSELMLVGGISDEIRPFLAKYSSPKVKVLGHRHPAELAELYSQGSVFVMASIEEGLATVQAQAMACGLPLICTTNAGGEDFLSADGIEGFVIPASDVEALKEKLALLHGDSIRCARMGELAMARVGNSCSWAHYGDTIQEIYQNILSAKHRSRDGFASGSRPAFPAVLQS